MTDKSNNLQDLFLNSLRKSKTPVTMFLVKGVKLQGIVTWFDNFSVLLRRDGQSQLVYKHAISTIMTSEALDTEPFAYCWNGKGCRSWCTNMPYRRCSPAGRSTWPIITMLTMVRIDTI